LLLLLPLLLPTYVEAAQTNKLAAVEHGLAADSSSLDASSPHSRAEGADAQADVPLED